MQRLIALALVVAVTGCATVREEDTAPWRGQPVAALETHPVFATMSLVRTQASDGTEIWNFVNGREVGSCGRFTSGYGEANVGYSNLVGYSVYNSFMHCMSNHAACNNIFYVRNGIVQRYVPIGSGGMRCYTDARVQPGFAGSTNYR